MSTNPFLSESTITGEQLERIADVGSCELIDGRIVPMSPTGDTHGQVELTVAAAINDFVKSRKLGGHVMVGEVGIYTRRRPDTVRGADVLYISSERYARQTRRGSFLEVAPELVIEILSPGDSTIELARKVTEYFEAGVDVVLVLNPVARRVRLHRSATEFIELTDRDTLTLGHPLPGLSVRVADLFGE